MTVRVIGLTGGIGTGKSTVAGILRELGAKVIDADVAAREVVRPGSPTLARIVETFGPGALLPDGSLDRSALRARIVSDPEAKRALEGITHPAILARVAEQVAAYAGAGAPVVFVEAALMVETGSWRRYDELWVVACAPEVQLRRVRARDGSTEAQARAIVAAQLPQADKIAVATRVLHNDGDLDALRHQVAEALAAVRP